MKENFSTIFNDWEKNNKIINKDIFNNNESFLLKRKLDNKKTKIPEIDLHHMTKNEAINTLKLFIISNKKSGNNSIKIIHGVGRHSNGKRVLKEAVIEWLKLNNNIIKYYRPGKTGEGGSGVTIAIIKNN